MSQIPATPSGYEMPSPIASVASLLVTPAGRGNNGSMSNFCTTVERPDPVDSIQSMNASIQQLLKTHHAEMSKSMSVLTRNQVLLQDEIKKINMNMVEYVSKADAGEQQAKAPLGQDELRVLKDHGPVTFSAMCSKLNLGTSDQRKAETIWKSLKVYCPQTEAKLVLAEAIVADDAAAGSTPLQAEEDDRGVTNAELIRMVSECLENKKEEHWKNYHRCHPMGHWVWFKNLDMPRKIVVFDSFMGVLIVSNAFTIGFSMDNESKFWDGLDMFFSISFLFEQCLKIYLIGVWKHYYSIANFSDACLVLIDWIQFLIQMNQDDQKRSPSASLFRVIRLIRLVRLARLLRMPIFSDLVSMITGLVGGLTTLIWSIALFFLIVYVCALMFREFFGRSEKENIFDYFNSVPRAMFTVFRCSFGDCSSATGVPIFEHITLQYGALYAVIYCIFIFLITVGLFNVISAIFVESTMKAAIENEQKKRMERLRNTCLWESRISTLMLVFLEHVGKSCRRGSVHDSIESLTHEEINAETFKKWVADERVCQALTDLDIKEGDHPFLFDILDCDNSGSIYMAEVVDGLARLRGEPRRSDIITVDLMVRSIQMQCNHLVANMNKVVASLPTVSQSQRHG
jgi:hypothetical protein